MSSFFKRLRSGLGKSSEKLNTLFATARFLDEATLQELEEELIAADLGPEAAGKIIEKFRSQRFGHKVSGEEIREALGAEIAEILKPVAVPLEIRPDAKPMVILMVGVNGTGKTTTIGKLAAQLAGEGKKVLLAAGDTFRAAATEQLEIWAKRANVPIVTGKPGSNPAGIAYEALAMAQKQQMDALLIDTAGRLHNKSTLMEELKKILRALQKLEPAAPQSVILTLDATTGQNAVDQIRLFQEVASLTGLVVTKIDGSARGGIVVRLAQEFALPIHLVGVGEGIEDLKPFSPMQYALGLTGKLAGKP